MTYPATEAARKEMWIEYSVSGGWIFYASLEGETGAEAYQRAREIAPQAQIFAVYACKKRNDSPHPDTETARKALYATARAFEVERRVSTKPRPSKGRGEPHRGQERAVPWEPVLIWRSILDGEPVGIVKLRP